MVEDLPKVVNSRRQSIYVHPSAHKRLVIAGSSTGCVGMFSSVKLFYCLFMTLYFNRIIFIGMWDIDIENNKGLLQFSPHQCAVNCISANQYDMYKLFSTSHDGTLLCADIEKGIFNNVSIYP